MRSFKGPLDKTEMVSLTMKKVRWAKNMYCDWREYRNNREDLESFECNLDDINTVTKEKLN